nr:allergen asp f 7 like [Quercus suber]
MSLADGEDARTQMSKHPTRGTTNVVLLRVSVVGNGKSLPGCSMNPLVVMIHFHFQSSSCIESMQQPMNKVMGATDCRSSPRASSYLVRYCDIPQVPVMKGTADQRRDLTSAFKSPNEVQGYSGRSIAATSDVISNVRADLTMQVQSSSLSVSAARRTAITPMLDSEIDPGWANATRTGIATGTTGCNVTPTMDDSAREPVQDVEWEQAGKQIPGRQRRWPFAMLPTTFAWNQQHRSEHKASPPPPDEKPSNGSNNNHFSFATHTAFSFRTTFDRILPPHKRYLGRFSRRSFLIILGIMLFGALALTIGLAAGLTVPSSNDATGTSAASGDHTGDMTFFTPGLGACGVTSGPNDQIVALSEALFDPQTPNGNPNNNPLCGQKITVSLGGKSIELTVVDRCTGCAENDIDTTESSFSQLADPSLGRVQYLGLAKARKAAGHCDVPFFATSYVRAIFSAIQAFVHAMCLRILNALILSRQLRMPSSGSITANDNVSCAMPHMITSCPCMPKVNVTACRLLYQVAWSLSILDMHCKTWHGKILRVVELRPGHPLLVPWLYLGRRLDLHLSASVAHHLVCHIGETTRTPLLPFCLRHIGREVDGSYLRPLISCLCPRLKDPAMPHHPVNEEKHNRRGLFLLVSFVAAGLCSLYPVMCFKAHSSREKAKLNSEVANVERQVKANEEEMYRPYPSRRHHSKSPARTARMPEGHRRHSSVHYHSPHGRHLRQYSEDDEGDDDETIHHRRQSHKNRYGHDYDRDIDRSRRHRHHGHAPPRRVQDDQSSSYDHHARGLGVSHRRSSPAVYIPSLQAQESSGSSHAPRLRSCRADRRLLKTKHLPSQHARPSQLVEPPSLTSPPLDLSVANIQNRPVFKKSLHPLRDTTLDIASSSPRSLKSRKQGSRSASPRRETRSSRSSESHGRSGNSTSSQELPSFTHHARTGLDDRLRLPAPDPANVQRQALWRRSSSSRIDTDINGSAQQEAWPRRNIKRPVERLQRRDGTMRGESAHEPLPSSSIVHDLESYFQRPVVHGETNYLKEYSPPRSPDPMHNPVPMTGFSHLKTQPISTRLMPPPLDLQSDKDSATSGTANQGNLLALGELRAPSYFARPRRTQQASSTSTPSTAVSPMTSVRHPLEPEAPTLIDQELYVATTTSPTTKSLRPRLKHSNALESISDHSLSSDKVPTLTQGPSTAILKRTLKSVTRKLPVQTPVLRTELPETVKVEPFDSNVILPSIGHVTSLPRRANVKKADVSGFRAFYLRMRKLSKGPSTSTELEKSKRSGVPRQIHSMHSKSLSWLLQGTPSRSLQFSSEGLNQKASRTSFATIQAPLTGPSRSMDESRRDSVGAISFEYTASDLEVTNFHQTPFSTRYHDARRAEKLAQRALLEEALLNIQHRAEDNEHTDLEYELDLPDHLPSSPLCPLSPKHKNGAAGICPMHGRKTANEAQVSAVGSGISKVIPLSRSTTAISRAPRIVYEGREGEELASERKWEAYQQRTLQDVGDSVR